MAAAIQPGQWVTVTVKKEPRTHGGRRTLVRMYGQDPAVRKDRERMKRARPRSEHQRGGRLWQDYPPHLRPTTLRPGTSFRVFATVDFLRQVEGISQYLDIAPAK